MGVVRNKAYHAVLPPLLGLAGVGRSCGNNWELGSGRRLSYNGVRGPERGKLLGQSGKTSVALWENTHMIRVGPPKCKASPVAARQHSMLGQKEDTQGQCPEFKCFHFLAALSGSSLLLWLPLKGAVVELPS